MQQNIHSQITQQGVNYSQKRNSIPSQVHQSQNIPNNGAEIQKVDNLQKLQIDQTKNIENKETIHKLKLIDEEIEKQKQFIQKLKRQNQIQKQQLQNHLQKSFLSLDPHEFAEKSQDELSDQLLQTKTQADFYLLQNRKNQATRELQTEEEKYRENIRRMQLRKNQMKKKLKEEQQIPIKIMDFKQLQKKKQSTNSILPQNDIQKPNQHKKDLSKEGFDRNSVKQSTKKTQKIKVQQKNDQFQANLIIQTESKRQNSIKSSEIKQKNSHKKSNLKNNNLEIKETSKHIKQTSEKNNVQKKNSVNVDIKNDINGQKSRLTAKSSHKKYSVKLSTVIVPEINDSIKEIQERKSIKKQNQEHIGKLTAKTSTIKQSFIKSQQSQKQINEGLSEQERNQQPINVNTYHNQKQQKVSQKQFIKSKSIQEAYINDVQIEKEKSVYSLAPQSRIKDQNLSHKQKSISAKSKHSSKKQQKVQLMYVPHAAKQPSHKSFKKTDKSIQWSEVDLSMYGKTNQILQSQDASQVKKFLNLQNNFLVQNDNQQSNKIEGMKINMKKNKLTESGCFQQISVDQKKSQKSINLAPVLPTKEISIKASINSRHSKASFVASRQGSVKQKVDRYDRFHREQSLKQSKAESKKSSVIQHQIPEPSIKQASYRSRKSNPVHNLNISKSKAQSVVNQSKSIKQSSKNQSPINIKVGSEVNESRVLISKSEITFLHNQIQRLEEKLLQIEEKQQKLARQKTEELMKLRNINIQEEKSAEVATNELKIQHSINDHHQQEQLDKQQKQEQQIPVIESQSKQLNEENENANQQQNIQPRDEQQDIEKVEENQSSKEQIDLQQTSQPKKQEYFKDILCENQDQAHIQQNDVEQQNLEPNLEKSYISQKKTIQHQINQISVIEAKFSQQKQELLGEIDRLKKVIRELQIEKIKSISHQNTIVSNKSQRPSTELNEVGVILNQNKKNQTLDPIYFDEKLKDSRQQKSPFGKIVRNAQDKNSSRVTENLDQYNKSIEKRFRINVPKKSSIISENLSHGNFESTDLTPLVKNTLAFDEDGNHSLTRKKIQSYPINHKDGYILVASQNHTKQNQIQSEVSPFQQKQDIKENLEQEQMGVRKSELTKQEILEKFHRTNKEFNNFIESSRIINETNSSMSSQNNLFNDKSHPSGQFAHVENKFLQNEEEDNPENMKLLHKISSSNLVLNQQSSNKNLEGSFTKITNQINQMKSQQKIEVEEEDEDEIPQIQIRDIQTPNLSQTPDVSFDQQQLMRLAKETFKIFDIEVNDDDIDFNMKKYKNCVIFTKSTETILWHYNGKFYIGGWKGKEDGSGEKTGYGIEIVPDKHIYKGQFMNGKKHGNGIIKTTNGNIYDGQWIQGNKNGQGIYYDATTKVVYQGQWKDGKKNGFGILKFSEKQYYKGTFLKSVKDGYGTQVFINGDKYKGEYRKGKFHGKGKYTWANSSVFEGDFYSGMRHGHGTWKSAQLNADTYIGAYLNDKKSGYGRYVWANGCIYEGNFSEDVKHGKGRLIYTDGRQIKGVWQEGSLLEAITQNPKEHHQEDILKRSRKIKLK